MQFFKEATYTFKQKFGYSQDEKALKLFDQAYHYPSTILPINILDQIAELSFQIEHYPKIINEIIKQLNSSNNTANNILKTLIITDYLLKYGCSGIIDDLKERIGLIRHYSEYKSECQEPLFQSIRQKAQNITIQLTNRNLLYKEKEIAKQMKLKIQMNKLKLQAQCSNVNDETQSKLDDMLENYIYKYMDKFHDKLESWGDQMNEKLDSLINNVATNSAYKKDENGYYYPESCMDDVMVVKDRGLDFKQNSQKSQMTNQNVVNQENVQPNKQVIKQKINLLD
ncbi:unnamed protein product (macronuclear) [Paramecium tetraurelia]|uniref:ENTH domain-containing protein n=1 Tax=Paramecium tetraurelia TaxID=5888 RepID=A0CIB8_PARTE|nr:uncharacterized protein GSPATT00007670001 [Paramecium tetraurelia]CAK70535.1 unnamed protein product [Paramecium tetraurelia]|eukprot:XP_001437932.1 hypothetical protein (macronuclear) [Paramecium tetraurelia strain d4-2]